MAVCELISVGTELLLGEILNTNARFLSRELAYMGIFVLRQSTVGDNPDRLAQTLKEALERSDIVIVGGGLGPTADDITKEVCCKTLGCDLLLDKDILDDLNSFFKARGLSMPQSNAKQAMVPKGGTVFKNLNGTAPGLAYEVDGKCVIMLPGPPREMEPMFIQSVKPFLAKYSDGIILSHMIRTFGIGESAMAEAVADLLENDNPTLAPYAKEGEAFLRLTARAKNTAEAESLAAPILEALQKRLGAHVYGLDVENLQTKLVEMLKERSLKIATAESCTAGYLAKRITEPAGASKVFECGIVAYSNDIKQKILGVSADTLKNYGAVSKETAISMAKGVRYLADADIGLSITGIAGPGRDADNKPVGLTYIALTDGERVLVDEISAGRSNDREYNRLYAASKALFAAIDYLRKFR